MPNHVTNEICFHCTPEEITAIESFMKSDDCEFDFNKLIPMPDDIIRGDLSFEDMERSNGRNWYDWSIKNWGTKWNAYSIEWHYDYVLFRTAWASVPEIVKKLSEKFPTVTMSYAWADEDIGYNVGRFDILNGEISNEFFPDYGSKTAYELAFSVLDISPEEYGMIYSNSEENYVYLDE